MMNFGAGLKHGIGFEVMNFGGDKREQHFADMAPQGHRRAWVTTSSVI